MFCFKVLSVLTEGELVAALLQVTVTVRPSNCPSQIIKNNTSSYFNMLGAR